METDKVDWEAVGEGMTREIMNARVKDVLWTKEQIGFLRDVFHRIGDGNAFELEEVLDSYKLAGRVIEVDGDLYLVREKETTEDVRRKLTRSGFLE
jgi:hypothetical protein